MIRWALALLALALPAAAQDQVRVRSGDHASFSRFVLEVPWSASQTVLREGRRVRLKLPDVAGNVPTDTVFRRIPRRRIADVDFDANGRVLRLRLACGCEVDVFGLDDRLLVIDVRDPGSRSAQPRNASVVGAAEPQTAEASPDPPDLQSGRPNRPPRAPRLPPSDPTEDAELRAAQRALRATATPLPPVPATSPIVSRTRNSWSKPGRRIAPSPTSSPHTERVCSGYSTLRTRRA